MSFEQPWRWSKDGETDPVVGVVVGSQSDIPKIMPVYETLEELGIPYEAEIPSAHRLAEIMAEYARTARQRGLHVLIAAAGGSAHLPGMLAGHTLQPVIGIAVGSTPDSLEASIKSQINMPGGVSLSYAGNGEAGAKNAAMEAAKTLALSDDALYERLVDFRSRMVDEVNGHRANLREIGPHKLGQQLSKK